MLKETTKSDGPWLGSSKELAKLIACGLSVGAGTFMGTNFRTAAALGLLANVCLWLYVIMSEWKGRKL